MQYLAAKEGLQDKLSAVLSDEKAQEQSAYWAGMAIKDYQVVKDAGGYDGNFEEFANQYFALNRLRIENYAQMSEEEKDEIWKERLAETAVMSDEEREFFEGRPSRKLYSLADNETDFVEYKGNPEGAIEKLLFEKRGYVSGAVYKEGVGDIDFIYGKGGKDGYGLAHIIENREKQGINGIEFVKSIPSIIRDGSVYRQLNQDGRVFIISKDKEALIRLDWDGEQRNWLLTAYMKKSGALPLGLTSGQGYLDAQTPASNSAFGGNIALGNINVKGDDKLYSKALEISEDDLRKVKNSLKKPLSQEAISRSFAARNAGNGRGYMSGGESTNAAIARSEGLATAQEIAKALKKELGVNVTAKNIINSQSVAETHHTGSHFKETDFYDVEEFDIEELNKELRYREWKEEQKRIRDERLKSLGAYKLSNEELAERSHQGTWKQVRRLFKSDRATRDYLEGIIIQNELDVNDNKLYSETFGSYDPSTQIVELMAGHNPSTLTHELSHHFFISHIRLMEEMGLNDRNRPVFDWLSKKGGHEINSIRDMQRADWENMTEAFIEYMNTNEAPNLATKSLFQRAKEWLLDNYRIHRTEASPEIRDYFDSLITKDTAMPDVSALTNQVGKVSEMLRQAQKGERFIAFSI